MKCPLLFRVFASALLLAITPGLRAEPVWIWKSKKAYDHEVEIFRKSFTVAGPVKSAALTLTCDNGATAKINGKPAAENSDWNQPVKEDVAKLLKPGENEIVIEGRNKEGAAALLASLAIEYADGKKEAVETSADWQVAAPNSTDFKPAVVIAKYGAGAWGKVLEHYAVGAVADPATLQLPPGFKVELLYTVPKAEQGSWVCLTVDPKGRLIAGDQYGGLYQITPPAIGSSEPAKVRPLDAAIGGAHGILYAFDSLYVMVNEKAEKGLWRLRDTDGDDHFGKPKLLRSIMGGGEHGVHGIVLGPDGKSLYFTAGNHAPLPDEMESARAVAWGEDHLLPRLWDPNGHAKGKLAPGGYICKTDPDGAAVEMFCSGFRNHYDLAFDANGEMFTYDSDMEWDMGTPWYMPTRINHCVDGGDYGWRSGAGRWPSYYADSLPAVLDIGPGSPTGMIFGTGAKFPVKYQRAFFGCDWTYGTLYAIHFTPEGATFRGEKEEFVAGKPLPLTDVVINPKDGAMYFTVGGRKTQSALFRVTYTGPESTAPAPRVEPTPEAKLRHRLEALHAEGTGPEAIDQAWPHLKNPDRFVRWAARVAIERQPAAKWADRALSETDPQAAIEALIALARVGDKALQPKIIEALGKLDFTQLPAEVRLPLLRAWELAFTRMGKPDLQTCAQIAAKFDPVFPHSDPLVNRELVSLLVYLDSPTVVAKTVPLLDAAQDADVTIASDAVLARNVNYARAVEGMHSSRPNRQAIAYAYALRNARDGWTPQLRKAFFSWFPRTHQWKGGNSFTKFIENIRADALTNCVPDAERAGLAQLSKQAPPGAPASFVAPKGPGKAYTEDDVVALAKDGLHGRNFEQGKAMFSSTLCIRCHHFDGEGGNIGPDLSGAGNRYSIRDLAENIIEPSKVISDQYGTDELVMKDGSSIIGRVLQEENGKLFVMTSAFAPDDLTPVKAADVKARKPYPVSMMPPGLINPLNRDELLDLFAYLLSGGNPGDKVFAK
jgi:putative heme-binding domain-containing protein